MKHPYIFIILLLLMLLLSSNSHGQDEIPALKGAYLGQKPAGSIAEVFAPGIISIDGRYEGTISFSPQLDEIYFGANNKNDETAIYYSKLEANGWTAIKKANFTQGEKAEEIHPFVSPDGKRIYFAALNSDLSDTRIWTVNRLNNSWSKAVKLDSPLNNDQVFYPNQAHNGDLYYYNLSTGKTYCAADENGRFSDIKPVEIEFGVHGFVAPSQDYLVVNARHKGPEGRNDNDIYVYFKQHDGTWTKPINLGVAVNSKFNDKTPSITPDGKYLFFSRDEQDGFANIYWVSTKVIEDLRPKP